ncbi:MAG: hypothetical protein R6V85_09445 [Polyangia bacterium]
MSRSKRMVAGALAAGLALAVLGWRGAAGASTAEPRPRVVCLCLAGIEVDLLREERSAGGGELEGERRGTGGCRCGGPPVGLPGEHVLTAIGAERGGALWITRLEAARPEAIAAASRELEERGWSESAASRLARSRAGGLPAFEARRGGWTLSVAALDGKRAGSVLLFGAALRGKGARR